MSPENFDEPRETLSDALDSLRRSWRALPTPLSPPERDEDDSFRALGQVWRELSVPSAPQERQGAGPRELAFLESLRAAWTTLPVPPVPLELLETERRRAAPHAVAPAQPWARRLRLVAAAAAAILVARLATDFPNHDGATGSAPESPTLVAQGPSAMSAGDLEPSPTSDSERQPTTQVAAVLTDNGIEMRSGPVRLLLIASGQPFDSAPTSEPSQTSSERPSETPETTRL